jgi:hypothetical protein
MPASRPGGRQRRQIVYSDQSSIEPITKMSPRLSRNARSCARLPWARIVSTPASDTMTPANCTLDSRRRKNSHDSAMIITGAKEFRMTPLAKVRRTKP